MEWIEETRWESWLGVGGLIGVAVAAVALLLLMVMKLKVHAFLALIIVSLLTAVAAGIPSGQLLPTMLWGFGDTLADVALLVAIGAMLGALVETSGGARSLADSMIRIFGEKRAPFALGIASLFVGFPIFMDPAFVLMVPIVYAVARRLSGNLLAYGIPVAAALSVMHVYLPPHPGPVAATQFLGANLGYVMILGLLLAFPTWFISGHLWGKFLSKRIRIDVPGSVFAGLTGDEEDVENPPKPGVIILILVLPLLLILLNTGLDTLGTVGVVDPDSGLVQGLQVIGETPVALLITLVLTTVLLGFRRGKSGTALEKVMDNALGPVCSVILITGAGGMFGGVLQATGIGDALAESLNAIGIPLIFAGYLIAVALRVAQGSATVALTTAAALIAPGVMDGGYGAVEIACFVLALAAGSVFAGHVNDSGFWLVGRLLNMDVKTTLKVWTVQQTIESVVAFAIVLIVYGLVGLF